MSGFGLANPKVEGLDANPFRGMVSTRRVGVVCHSNRDRDSPPTQEGGSPPSVVYKVHRREEPPWADQEARPKSLAQTRTGLRAAVALV